MKNNLKTTAIMIFSEPNAYYTIRLNGMEIGYNLLTHLFQN
jgi:hypothetical protein